MKNLMNKIHNVDCLEFMKTVPDNYFDLVLTDPPYGLGLRTVNGGSKKNTQTKFIKDLKEKKWDDDIPSDEIFNEIFRISKNQIIFGGNYFNLPPSRGFIVWDKMTYIPTMSQVEFAWTSYDSPARLVKINSNNSNRQHPTQKPSSLMEFCIKNTGDEFKNLKVFDPFMGSGTTAVACQSLGLDWCGCELEADYVAIANKRLEQVQGSLF